jgi:D-alanyl-D-alanine carboxypeptidase
MNRHVFRGRVALFTALAAILLASAPAAANPGNPPAVRTASGGIIVKDILTEHRRYADWHVSLVDPIFMVGSSYAPGDLASVSQAGIAGTGYVRSLVLRDLRALDQAARAAGIRLRVVSSYRSYWKQKATFDYWVRVSGYTQALRYSARAGHSEHQLGTTLDFSFVGGADPWNYADFGATRAGAWLKANAWRYGWVMSYPKGAEHLTGYGYEPWHYRYFGRTLAAQHRASGLVPRYWLWRRN